VTRTFSPPAQEKFHPSVAIPVGFEAEFNRGGGMRGGMDQTEFAESPFAQFCKLILFHSTFKVLVMKKLKTTAGRL